MSNYSLRLSDDELDRYRRQGELVREREADLWARAGITDGADVIDLGCGPGGLLVPLCDAVGERGSVVGVDADREALEHARAVIDAGGLRRARVQEGSAVATGLPPVSADVVSARLLLAHNGGSEQAIVDHAAELVRPGGCVYLTDVEMTMGRFRPPVAPLVELHERYMAFQHDRGNDMQIGLRLAELLTAAGLEVLEHAGRLHLLRWAPGMRGPFWAARDAMVADGAASPADLERWEREFAELDAAPEQPVAVLAGFVALARRPAGPAAD